MWSKTNIPKTGQNTIQNRGEISFFNALTEVLKDMYNRILTQFHVFLLHQRRFWNSNAFWMMLWVKETRYFAQKSYWFCCCCWCHELAPSTHRKRFGRTTKGVNTLLPRARKSNSCKTRWLLQNWSCGVWSAIPTTTQAANLEDVAALSILLSWDRSQRNGRCFSSTEWKTSRKQAQSPILRDRDAAAAREPSDRSVAQTSEGRPDWWTAGIQAWIPSRNNSADSDTRREPSPDWPLRCFARLTGKVGLHDRLKTSTTIKRMMWSQPFRSLFLELPS